MRNDIYEVAKQLAYLVIDLKNEVRNLNDTVAEISGQLQTLTTLKGVELGAQLPKQSQQQSQE